DAHDSINARADAAVEIPLLEARHDVVLDDALRDGVRQDALEAVADLDLQLAVVLGDDEQHAVVDAFAAQLPRLVDAHGVLLDRLGLRAGDEEQRDLRALALLE